MTSSRERISISLALTFCGETSVAMLRATSSWRQASESALLKTLWECSTVCGESERPFLAASLQERSVPRGDDRRAELLQFERAQTRDDLGRDQRAKPLCGRIAEAERRDVSPRAQIGFERDLLGSTSVPAPNTEVRRVSLLRMRSRYGPRCRSSATLGRNASAS